MKIVINDCYGGFAISRRGIEAFCQAKASLTDEEIRVTRGHGGQNIARHDPILVKLVETRGSKFMSSECAELKVVNIPDELGDNYWIADDDGAETVMEPHKIWR